MNPQFNRRDFIKTIAAALPASFLGVPAAHASAKARVVVVGGGFGGAAAAKYIKAMAADVDVTVVERNPIYTSCPLSNDVISGHRAIEDLQIGYDALKRRGINVVIDTVMSIDPDKKRVALKVGQALDYDALLLSPGIDFDYDHVQGYSEEIANSTMPHAWKAGPQTLALRKRLQSMQDGGTFIISVPPGPFRCPPGPYERASHVASYFKERGMNKSKVLILDANDSFSKKGLFEQAWKLQYPGMIEWVSGAAGGKVTRVDAKNETAFTDFGDYKADVLNLIPPHRASVLARATGLANDKGWCPVNMLTMESSKQPNIWVVGDACVHGDLPVYPMPKSAHTAVTQAKVAAGAIVAKLSDLPPPNPYFVNTCYSITAPGWGFSVVHIYGTENGKLTYLKNAGGVSPINAPALALQRAQEAEYADGWLKNILADAFS